MGAGTAEAGAASGALQGAAAGTSAMPGIGTAIGAVAGGAMSLIQAGKQAAAKREADRIAQESAARAEREIEKNFLGAVQVPVKAYNEALKENTAQQMQALSALKEADLRALVGGVGRVNEVTNEQANTVTNQLADRLYNLDVAQANEKGQTADAIGRLYLDKATGAQKAAMAAEMARIKQQQGALSAFGTAASGIVNALSPVYKQGEDEMTSPYSKMQSVMIPEPKAPTIQDQQLQGAADPDIMSMLDMFMKNYR
jgi:hypothetical protein